MQILDTNVVSALMQAEQDSQVTEWLDLQQASTVWTTSITVYEVRYGLDLLPNGKKRWGLEAVWHGILQASLQDRILPFDKESAQHTAALAAMRYKTGNNIEIRDTMIAGIALARRATIVTRNTKHFNDLDIDVINPWKD
jgi:predicted nucleic acid-binding protein